MCVDGKTKSDAIRGLVGCALYARRHRQGSTDPAFKEILKSFDDQVGVRLHHLGARLVLRTEVAFDLTLSLVSYLYLEAAFGVDELQQVRLLVTPESVSEEGFLTRAVRGEEAEGDRDHPRAAQETQEAGRG